MKALIIVDVQNDFCSGGALEVPHGNDIIPIVNRVQGEFDLIVATQDWHPHSHKSFASNHTARKPFETIDLFGLQQVLWPDHCVQLTPGAAFHPDLDIKKIEAIFRKGMDQNIDSYSGFYDNGHRKSTGLAGYLRERQVKDVYVCGLAADYCVYYTAKDSLKERFSTYYIEDAVRAISAEGFDRAKSDLVQAGCTMINSASL